MRDLLSAVLLSVSLFALAGCQGLEDQAVDALEAGDYEQAEALLTEAARAAVCPERGRLLLARAHVQELGGSGAAALESTDKAVALCPDYVDARWARAQGAAEAGNRALALEDAALIKDQVPDAKALYDRLSAEVERERGVRRRAHQLVQGLKEQLKVGDGSSEPLEDDLPALLAREVPVPVTLTYAVQQRVVQPQPFKLEWTEVHSYRGDPTEAGYVFVRKLEVPPLDQDVPMPVRLLMGNLRLPMRFRIDAAGAVVDASWIGNGPQRGMRPDMLQPEVEAMLKRRRESDPGATGQRSPGETWQHQDLRVVDGRPVVLDAENKVRGWEQVSGVRALVVETRLSGLDYTGDEVIWLHPETAIPLKWTRTSTYATYGPAGQGRWREQVDVLLVDISGAQQR